MCLSRRRHSLNSSTNSVSLCTHADGIVEAPSLCTYSSCVFISMWWLSESSRYTRKTIDVGGNGDGGSRELLDIECVWKRIFHDILVISLKFMRINDGNYFMDFGVRFWGQIIAIFRVMYRQSKVRLHLHPESRLRWIRISKKRALRASEKIQWF